MDLWYRGPLSYPSDLHSQFRISLTKIRIKLPRPCRHFYTYYWHIHSQLHCFAVATVHDIPSHCTLHPAVLYLHLNIQYPAGSPLPRVSPGSYPTPPSIAARRFAAAAKIQTLARPGTRNWNLQVGTPTRSNLSHAVVSCLYLEVASRTTPFLQKGLPLPMHDVQHQA